MYNNLMHRIVILSGFAVALLCFVWNMMKSGDILYSAFVSLCVLFAVSTVFLIATQSIAGVLFKHLSEKKAQQMKEELAKRKQQLEEENRKKAKAS
ncbi:MAG: hypothetical protein A2020_06405 [Lentisphaerae bacterium GWF2_45_14]|nr:MAG: hypothetical protein A2020_06405 [Lentisphaerae bacterium GWF2_45_14]